MEVSFLITNYNMAPLVESCILHVVEHMAKTDISYEILLGDNSTNPDWTLSAEQCAKWPVVTFERIAHNPGWIGALNQLMKKATGAAVCIMHPDIEFGEDCVSMCLQYLKSHPQVGVVAPNPQLSDGRPATVRMTFPTVGSEGKRLLGLFTRLVLHKKLFREFSPWDHRNDTCLDTVLSFCFFCRRELLRDIGRINAGLRSYYGNDYICMEARKRGNAVMILSRPTITHYERHTPRSKYATDERMNYKSSPIAGGPHMHKDRLRFIHHFYPLPTEIAIRLVMLVEFSLHAGVAFIKGRGRITETCRAHLAVCRLVVTPIAGVA